MNEEHAASERDPADEERKSTKRAWKDPTLKKISAAMGTKSDPTMATSNDPSTYKLS